MTEETIPIFQASDASSLSEWYARLGLKVESEHRFAPGPPLYRILRRGTIRLHLSEHRCDAKCPGLFYLYVSDLAAVAEEFGVGAANQPWGSAVKLVDPDGNRLRIGEAVPPAVSDRLADQTGSLMRKWRASDNTSRNRSRSPSSLSKS